MSRGNRRRRRRAEILARDEFRCVYCGADLPAEELTVDHVEPRAKGGDRSEGNLVTACLDCNRAKGAEPAWRFLRDRPRKRDHFLRTARAVWPRLRRAVRHAAYEGPSQGPGG